MRCRSNFAANSKQCHPEREPALSEVEGAHARVEEPALSAVEGTPTPFGLELSGAYMFLLMALVGIAIAWGLMRRINLVRRAAMLVAIAGIAMLVPPVSAAAAMVQPGALILGGLGIIVRVIIAWYLSRSEAAYLPRYESR